MPHLTLEYSANLREQGRFDQLCRSLAQTLVAQRNEAGEPVFPIGGVRVRAIACEDWCVADGSVPEAGFVHARLLIGAGRSAAQQQACGDALFAQMKTHFAALYERQGLALSLELGEFSEAGTWKHNNLHQRFKPKA
ncbi:5-carboxymethyl-2-hydroxymuconate Delta-isomerase [Paucibacter sp. APW11]|uniref:5-carboxymethyl-2-hydroxymuconate Delta-isomerase n=1 Tax=Roseateles aquae TaxID=3077235 RepID=A0ABU3PBC0_9BURK|nr:5-carboxymethyl-2-hydroxymuconate Delta-isomerase [Paucibacter sp. APW11]MDT8999592.1 5-carboxymethyl-2-hydroxymuconate Delta-isomerase [Paucibacter sp. APW11]